MKKIALICPWYGDNIRGGAEKECNYLAHGLKENGYPVEVFSTCVPQASDPRGINVLPEGLSEEGSIPVRRFLVKAQDLERYIPANLKLFKDDFTIEDEQAYIEEDINSPDMYGYIREHKNEYSFFVFMPYLYGISINGAGICPEKSVLIPCLHDESYAYMHVFQSLMNDVRGVLFLSEPEKELAVRLYGLNETNMTVLGAQVDTGWEEECSAEAFREKYNIREQFILFAGRKDSGKKADELVEFFIRYKKEYPNSKKKLVFIGGGTLNDSIPDEYRDDIIELGFVSSEDKHNAFAAAEFLCNPSQFESFSIVIMESWLASRPVLVSGKCPVTKSFCLKTNGGLFYDSYGEFAECVNFLSENENTANQMGLNGKRYVLENFTQEKIIKKMITFLESI